MRKASHARSVWLRRFDGQGGTRRYEQGTSSYSGGLEVGSSNLPAPTEKPAASDGFSFVREENHWACEDAPSTTDLPGAIIDWFRTRGCRRSTMRGRRRAEPTPRTSSRVASPLTLEFAARGENCHRATALVRASGSTLGQGQADRRRGTHASSIPARGCSACTTRQAGRRSARHTPGSL